MVNGEAIEYFFKKFVKPKWQPNVVALNGDAETKERIITYLTDIGKRIIGEHFVLDEVNTEIYLALTMYILGHGSLLDTKKGIYVWGKVGCGKTTMMKVVGIFAQIFNRGNAYRIEHCHDACHAYQIKGAESLMESDKGTVCFDELGSEPRTTSYYGTQVPVMAMHIDKRYRLYISEGRWTHFTSNFDMIWVGDNYGVREMDRITEMCNILKMPGGTRRQTQ